MTETTLSASPEATARTAITAFAVDAVLVVVFTIVGRASHERDLLRGLGNTIWPFLLALVVAWVVSRAWLAPMAPLHTGVPVWAVTTIAVMLLRWAVGQGVQATFIVVGAAFLFAFLVGWRFIAALWINRRR